MLQAMWQLFVGFTRATLLGYGGGPSTIPLIQVEVVKNFKWLSTDDFSQVLAMANALPGPLATKMAGYIGFKVAGWPGAVAALIGTVVPTVLAMVALYYVFGAFKAVPAVAGAVKAVKPVVIVLLLSLITDMWPKSVVNWTTAAIGAAAWVLIQYVGIHPALVVVGSLALGAAVLR